LGGTLVNWVPKPSQSLPKKIGGNGQLFNPKIAKPEMENALPKKYKKLVNKIKTLSKK